MIEAFGQLPPSEQDPEQVRRAADEILAGVDYDRARPGWLDRVIEWIGDRIEDLLESLPLDGLFGGGSGGSNGVAILILVIGAALLIWLVVRYRRLRVIVDPVPESTVLIDPWKSSDEWRADAVRCESEGRWREAIRAEYRALVAELLEAELLTDIPGRTAGEYQREVRDDVPSIAEPFDAATGLFEPAWYSKRAMSAAGLASMRRLSDEILSAEPERVANGSRPETIGGTRS